VWRRFEGLPESGTNDLDALALAPSQHVTR
jgi:hypothetical protein